MVMCGGKETTYACGFKDFREAGKVVNAGVEDGDTGGKEGGTRA